MNATIQTTITVQFTPNTTGRPRGKVADAELRYKGGVMDGLRLVGISLWERRDGDGITVKLPARPYVVGGDPRHYTLLRPVGANGSVRPLCDWIRAEYARLEAQPNEAP